MRTDETAALRVAKTFLANASLVTLWTNFSDELRDMMVDSAVMDAIRMCDDESKLTAAQVVAFRDLVVKEMADGVFIGKTRRGLMFERDREERRERAAYERGLTNRNKDSSGL